MRSVLQPLNHHKRWKVWKFQKAISTSLRFTPLAQCNIIIPFSSRILHPRAPISVLSRSLRMSQFATKYGPITLSATLTDDYIWRLINKHSFTYLSHASHSRWRWKGISYVRFHAIILPNTSSRKHRQQESRIIRIVQFLTCTQFTSNLIYYKWKCDYRLRLLKLL